jgi:hypothetical protein
MVSYMVRTKVPRIILLPVKLGGIRKIRSQMIILDCFVNFLIDFLHDCNCSVIYKSFLALGFNESAFNWRFYFLSATNK